MSLNAPLWVVPGSFRCVEFSVNIPAEFHTQPSFRFAADDLRKRKCAVNCRCVDENALWMSEVKGKKCRLGLVVRIATLAQVITCYNIFELTKP